LANEGIGVDLYEMRPAAKSGAHKTENFAELVCSNSLGNLDPSIAQGFLNNELLENGSFLIKTALECRAPGVDSLVLDKELFSKKITGLISGKSEIKIIRREVQDIDALPCIIATGPLTSKALSQKIAADFGSENFSFFDAAEPVVAAESIDFTKAFQSPRFSLRTATSCREDTGCIYCPMNSQEFDDFYNILTSAPRVELKPFEDTAAFFKSHPPIELLAVLGKDALIARTLPPLEGNARALVHLRQDDMHSGMYHISGFHSSLKWGAQQKLIHSIPGLAKAEILAYGVTHKNTFIKSPALLSETLESRTRPGLFFAGQIAGTEGYSEAIATGFLAGKNAACFIKGRPFYKPAAGSMAGALARYISFSGHRFFQPVKASWGIIPPTVSPPCCRC
jgi:methylenetetrahydrofolate--tRNA-(uracil-5-)-methyltransferase